MSFLTASLAFTALFTDCKGDPTYLLIVKKTNENNNDAFAYKLKH